MSTLTTGTAVRVRAAYPPGHVRTPYFTRGKTGVIIGIVGRYANPEELAYGRAGLPPLTLYRVQFRQRDLWRDYAGNPADTVVADLYENWLEPLAEATP